MFLQWLLFFLHQLHSAVGPSGLIIQLRSLEELIIFMSQLSSQLSCIRYQVARKARLGHRSTYRSLLALSLVKVFK